MGLLEEIKTDFPGQEQEEGKLCSDVINGGCLSVTLSVHVQDCDVQSAAHSLRHPAMKNSRSPSPVHFSSFKPGKIYFLICILIYIYLSLLVSVCEFLSSWQAFLF